LIAAVTEGMRASGCALAIVCGRDQDYARLAAALVVALRIGGANEVWIAGRPPSPEHAESWGLDPELPPRFVYLGGDVLAELEDALAKLGLLEDPHGDGSTRRLPQRDPHGDGSEVS
jgi:methylmalonyl-CoA mutase